MDENGSRTLDRDELATGLEDFGVSMTSSAFNELFTYLDRSGRGVVTYNEFLEALRVGTKAAFIQGHSRMCVLCSKLLQLSGKSIRNTT